MKWKITGKSVIDHVSVITDEDTDLMVDEFIAVETRT